MLAMRTILALAVTVSLALVGCGSEDAPAGTVTPSETATAASEGSATGTLSPPATPTPTASPAATPSPTATQTAEATSEPTVEPTATPTVEPTVTQPTAVATTAPAATAAPTQAAPPPPAAPSGVTANIQGFGYPYELQVAAGTTVTWVNHDAVPHDVVAYDGSWASVLLGQGQTYSRTFTTAGRYPYTCSIHPYMQAAVVVQ